MRLLNYIYNLPDDTVKTRLDSNIVTAKSAFVLFLDILIAILIAKTNTATRLHKSVNLTINCFVIRFRLTAF